MPAIEPTCPTCHTSLVDQQCTVCKPSSSKSAKNTRRGSDEFDDGEDFPSVTRGNPWNGNWPQGSLSPIFEHPSVTDRY